VFLHLQPYKKTSPKEKTPQKLAPKFYGLHEMIQHIGHMPYKSAPPSHFMIHPTSHASCLKKVVGSKCKVETSLLELDEEGPIWI